MATASLPGSSFESDGNLVVTTSGNLDWTNVPNRVRGDDLASGSLDNSMGQGTKEDDLTPTVVAGSIPPNKSDLTRFYVANEKGSNDHEFMYLAWERTNTLGSANMDFEINQDAQPPMTTPGVKSIVRTAGDLLVRYDFGGSGAPVLSLVRWITSDTGAATDCNASGAKLPCWGALPGDTNDGIDGIDDNQIDLTASGFAEGAVYNEAITDKKNPPTITDPIASVTLAPLTFGEAAIDLTASGVFAAGECTNFGSVYLKSRSSDSFTAETKDFIAPRSISINNCGGLKIRKVTVGGAGTFDFDSSTLEDQTPDDDATKFSLTTTAAGSAGAADTGSAYAGILAGTYDVTEAAKSGWTLTDITCRNADDSVHASTTDLTAGTLSVDVAVDDDVTCTFTNTAKATLIVAKETIPDGSAQSFTFTKSTGFGSGNGGTFSLTDGTNTGTAYADVLPGTYTVTETVPSGWKSPPAIVCTGDSGSTNVSSGTGAVATFDLQSGETVTCTYTNTELAKVTITKRDDDGTPGQLLNGATFGIYKDVGPASTGTVPGIEDFNPATPNSPAPVTTCAVVSLGTCSTGNLLDPAEAYWVVETTTPAGYTTADPQRITPTAGQNVQLTFVDRRQFKVITIVCQNSNNSLYSSSVTLNKEGAGSDNFNSLNAAGLAAFNTANGTSLTQAQVCALTGAVFSPRHKGSYNGNVTIP